METASKMRRVVAAASFGTVLEWYDFFLYGTAAALVFPKLFFPAEDPLIGTLLSFAAYATGFLARPLGGFISGHFGDRYGRKRVLLITLLVMGLGTAAIGVLPSYAMAGIWAPGLLVLLRLIQGLATGGEWGGASLLTLEHTKTRRGFWGSFMSAAVYVGMIIGNLIFVVLNAILPEDQLLSWGWRIPFLLSLVIVVIGVYMRRRIDESPEFERLEKTNTRARMPILEALRKHPRNIAAIFLMRIGQNTSFYIVSVFCLSYATGTLKMESWVTLTALMLGALAAALICPLWGNLADHIGFTKVMTGSLIASAIIAFPVFIVLGTKSAVLIIVAIIIAIAGVNASNDAIQPGYFSTMFGARIRYSGMSIGRELGTIVGGGLAPLIATWLLVVTGGWWAVAGWMVVTSIAGLVGVALVKRLDANELDEGPAASETLTAAAS